MRRMWSGRTIAAASVAALLAGRAALSVEDSQVESRVAAVLERRGLGPDALLVIDNLLAHGPPPPPAAPPLVLGLLARPSAAADAGAIFEKVVPASLASLHESPSGVAFDELLQAYIAELAQAQRALRAAMRPFDDEPLLRELALGLPSAAQLLAVADATDQAQLERANLLFIEATARFVRRLGAAADLPAEGRTFQSAIGTVAIGTRGNDRHGAQAALIIDPGGDDAYERAPARNGAVSVIIDLGGNDEYRGDDVALRALSAIVDLAGDDRYSAPGSGLGAAIAGASLVIDFSGNDLYEAKFFAQGAGALGIGALVDLGGDDRYRVEAWGQGFGIAGGTGLLWDRGGADRYAAGGVPDPFGRGAGLSGAQGVGLGARDRLGGGFGILRDDAGDDVYEAQMFAQGSGYYYGLGMLWDRGGADRYRAFRYAQGNGTHQALGVLRDEAGDDHYSANGYAQGMGLDVAVGVLVDAAGGDTYRAGGVSQGAATANGFGLLADAGGGDRFELGPDDHAWGRAEWLRGLPTVAILLHGSGTRFKRDGKTVAAPPEDPPVAVQAPSADTCPSSHPGEALICRVRGSPDPEAVWSELKATLLADPATPLAGWIAIALARRPPGKENAEEIATLLAKTDRCNPRALALRAWPTLPAAQAGVRSGCFRLQAAALAAFARLGAAPPGDVKLPSFLRALPPQEDTF
jgi:hypothetical protein